MAQIFPTHLSQEILSNPKRQAEIKVYNALEKQLSKKFRVYYSSPWIGENKYGEEIDGECDFTITHPEFGILFIEVKGGGISINLNNEWKSKDRHGVTHNIKNPVEQARKSKYHFLNKFKEQSDLKDHYLNINHAVILPDVKDFDNFIRPDMPRKLFALFSDMELLEPWIKQRLLDSGSNPIIQLTVERQNTIHRILVDNIELNVPQASYIYDDLRKIEVNTTTQSRILKSLEDNKRMAISGGAGSGKTILAIQKSKILSDQNMKVLLLCYNRPLGDYLHSIFEDSKNVKASNYHKFCFDIARLNNSVFKNNPEELSKKLIDNYVMADCALFDAIIIDEGQDFESEWLESLQLILKEQENGIFYIFYDNNQLVSGTLPQIIWDIPPSNIKLIENLRNTKKIFTKAQDYYEGETYLCEGPEGEEIIQIEYNSLREGFRLIDKKIHSYLDEQLKEEDIVVLLPDSEFVAGYMQNSVFSDLRTLEDGYKKEGEIRVDTYRRFKGLEGNIVIMLVTQSVLDSREMMYSAITRAKGELVILLPA